MAVESIALPFEPDLKDAWKERVEKELKGKSYSDFLEWQSLDGFQIEAWQDQLPDPTPNLPALGSPWRIVEPVYETDAQAANKKALDALMAGAEAIWFQKGFLGAAAEVAGNQIDQSIAPVFIEGESCKDVYRGMLKTGSEPEIQENTFAILNGQRFRERGATAVQEVALLLTQGIEWGRKHGFDAPMMFQVGNGSAFLTEIAKMRALRWLWSGILLREGQPSNNPTILATNLCNGYARNDEHSNILRATSAAMAGVIGGAQFIMIQPWDRHWNEKLDFSQRISRNIQTLLKEEARMDKNLNPADGSYFLEHLAVAITDAAWQVVQTIEKEGGFSAYARSGSLKNLLQASRQKQLLAYQEEHRTLLGVNKYPPADATAEPECQADQYELLPDYLHLPSELQNQAV